MDIERADDSYGMQQADLMTDEKSSSMFQPDVLLSSEYLQTRSRRTPQREERLLLAVLADAIHSFQENHLARQGRRKRLFEDVRQWIFENDRDWIFGFASICDILGFDPEYIRQGLVRWRQKQLSRHQNPRFGIDQLVTIDRHGRIATRAAY